MKPCDVTKLFKFYKARDSANQPKTSRNCARLASFLLFSVFPPWLALALSLDLVRLIILNVRDHPTRQVRIRALFCDICLCFGQSRS